MTMTAPAVCDQNIFEFEPDDDTALMGPVAEPAAGLNHHAASGQTSAAGLFGDRAEPATRPHGPVTPPTDASRRVAPDPLATSGWAPDEPVDFDDYLPRRRRGYLPPTLRRIAVSLACALTAFVIASALVGVLHAVPSAKPGHRASGAPVAERPTLTALRAPRLARRAALLRRSPSPASGRRHHAARAAQRPSAPRRTRPRLAVRPVSLPAVVGAPTTKAQTESTPGPPQPVVEPARGRSDVAPPPLHQPSPPASSGGPEFGFEQ